MSILKHQEHRLLRSQSAKLGDEHVEGSLLTLSGREIQYWTAARAWNSEKLGQQWERFAHLTHLFRDQRLEFGELQDR
jgi:hypothetical protein